MSRTTVILSDSSGSNSEATLCRLCMKNNDSYYNIFTSNVTCEITVKDGLHDLVGLQVALGDGLPATICPLCLKKLMELSDYKRICFESDAELRKCSSRNLSKSIKEEKTADDNAGSSADTKECIPDAIEGTPQFACSVQMTEIYIPVQDCQSPRANVMLNVKEENEQLLCGGNYPAFNSPNTAGIISEASDPLANDDLPAFTEDEKLFNSCKMTIDSMTLGPPGPSTPDKVLMETTPTSCMLKERNVRIDLSNDSIAPSVSVTDTQSKTVASRAGEGRNVIDEDLEEGSALRADKIFCNSIPNGGQSYKEHIPESKNSVATMPVLRGRGGAPNTTDSLRLIRIGESRRSGIEAVMEDKEEK
ncbi:uncharacterized protein LOC124172727 [Ischnura elegans]|uniref:uncharacterized protein LOC124172727 n=1 Tax=Ischnura elegans TaxID=197161 RepID=UPI001ED8A5D9|nr:uncharacterized protein LOC124172727 [Ischnura elegans]